MADDPDNDILTYSVPDTAPFSINAANGQLMTKGALNHEALTSTPIGAIEVVVTATDSSGASDTITVTVNVTDVDEAPTFSDTSPSAIQGAVRREIVENMTSLGDDSENTYTATDPEAGMVTLSLSGDDMSMFELGGAVDNVLAFKMGMEPDFEMPSDKNPKDNIYEVTVVATAGGKTAGRDVTVKVTNVEEAGKVTLSGAGAQPRVGSEMKATLADSDGGEKNVMWQWSKSDTSNGTFTDIDKATMDTYMVMDADLDMYLKATATYLDKTYAPDTDPLQDDANATSSMFSNTAISMASAIVGGRPDEQAAEVQ